MLKNVKKVLISVLLICVATLIPFSISNASSIVQLAPFSTISISGSNANDSSNAAAMLKDMQRGDPNNVWSSNWAHFYSNNSRSIVSDLGVRCEVNKIMLTCIQDISSGIYFPSQVTYYFSNDNINWTQLGAVSSSIPTNQSSVCSQDFALSNIRVFARYIKLVVPVDVWVYADELQLFGYSKDSLALSKTVTITGADSQDSSNAASMLTDGMAGTANPLESNWAHFLGTANHISRSVVVDLGSTSRITYINMGFCQSVDYGIKFPSNVTYYLSNDGSNWTQAGVINTSIPRTQTGNLRQDFTLWNVDKYARYIKAVVPTEVYTWVYSDEIDVKGYNRMNIANGLSYSVTQGVSTNYSFAPNDAFISGKLTDGIYGDPTNLWDAQWQKACHGASRSIIVNLGQQSSVNGFMARFLQCQPQSVLFPRNVVFSVSQDGSNWSDLGTVSSSVSLANTTQQAQVYSLDMAEISKAVYVKITYNVDIWTYCDEIEVYGWSGVTNGENTPSITAPQAYPNAYLSPDQLGGSKDIILMYNGYNAWNPSDTSLGLTSSDKLIPYVGYKNTNGNITDFMFDSFLWLPIVCQGPNGSAYYCDPAHPALKSDWDFYLDNLFQDNYNLKALNVATSNVKTILGDSSKKIKIYIGIPYPTSNQTSFGDVDGDGISENLATTANRLKVCKWYIDNVISRWNSANLSSNMELAGFYWFEEQTRMGYAGTDELSLISQVGNYVKADKSKLFTWIPYYQAEGFSEAYSSLGFNGVSMQPNYCFSDWTENVIAECADICKKYGMSPEIEVHNETIWTYANKQRVRVAPALTQDRITKYRAYLNYGVDKGYMTNTVHMYYQHAGPGVFYDSSVDPDPYIRSIYDDTYKFIKGIYTKH